MVFSGEWSQILPVTRREALVVIETVKTQLVVTKYLQRSYFKLINLASLNVKGKYKHVVDGNNVK